MTGQPAALWGLADRGTVEVGKAADLVAFNPDTVGETHPERAWDFPADGDRLIARSEGIEHIWVNGTPIRQDGTDLEGTTPGILVDSR